MSTSVKKNIFYSLALAISLYIFPLVTFPYVTRTLGVDGIGICNYVSGVIDLFCIISMMGMAQMGIREIARSKGDKSKLSETFSSLIVLNLVTTFVAIAVLLILIFLVPQFKEHKVLLFIGIPKILFNTLLIEWFYKGLENFKYVTIRSIIVRILYVVAIFVFVRNTEDYGVFFSLSVVMVIMNATINIIYSKKFTRFVIIWKRIRDYIQPFFKLGIYQLLTFMYTSFNVVFLGMVCGTTEVGYYSTAVKLYSVIIAIFSAFTGAMMPRMSVYIENNELTKFNLNIKHSISILFLFSLPIIIVAEIYSNEIICLIAGTGYEGAVSPMRIVFPLMLIIGLEQIFIAQILIPFRKDNAILTNSIIGASVGLIANFALVPLLASIGSAITWVVSELSVLLSALFFIHKDSLFTLDVKHIVKYLLYALPPALLIFVLHEFFILNMFWSVLMMSGCVAFLYVYFIIIEIVMYKNPIIINNLVNLKKKINLW